MPVFQLVRRVLVSMLLVVGLVLSAAGSPAQAVDPPTTGSASGTVSDPHGALEGAFVNAYLFNSDSSDVTNEGSATTDALGQWQIPDLPPGSYYFAVNDTDGTHSYTYSNGKSFPPETADATSGVYAVHAGEDTHPVDVLMPFAPNSTLHGRVQDGSATPLDNILVEARPHGAAASTDPVATSITYGGDYDLYVSQGSYDLLFSDLGPSYADATLDDVSVLANETKNLDPVTLGASDQSATAAGTVTIGGNPAPAGTEVTLYRAYTSYGTPQKQYVDDTTTDAAGHYTFSGLAVGKRYSVSARVNGYTQRWLGNVTSDEAATTFLAAATNDLATIAFPAGASVSGTVSDSAGTLQGVRVAGYRWDADTDSFDYVDDVQSGANGTYTLPLGESGDYTLFFEVDGASDVARSQWLGNLDDQPATNSGPGVFTATAGVPVTGTNITLDDGSTVSGTITDTAGALAGATVSAWHWNADDLVWEQQNTAVTGSDGRYSLPLGQTGRWTLYVDGLDTPGPAGATWLGGLAQPTDPSGAGTFGLTTLGDDVTKDVAVPNAAHASGTVHGTGDVALGDAEVRGFLYDDGWTRFNTTNANSDGTWSMKIPTTGRLTFRASSPGYFPEWVGGTRTAPATATDNSSSFAAGGDLTGSALDFTLDPRESALGHVAGQNLDYCRTHSLSANDDDSSDAVTIPFPLKFFGTEYSELFVNNNGNITFGSASGDYTPEDLTGPNAQPRIAPFFADVDTDGAGSSLVTWGSSPDNKTFCVNWADVGYYSSNDDKLNTFQLILTSAQGQAGRDQGDFDIRMNYDKIEWETGEADDGVNGLGGTSAGAGFTAGTGEDGTFYQFPGSLANGAFLDGGPHALVAGQHDSDHVGRYDFKVRNSGLVSTLGGLSGTVTRNDTSAPVAGASVNACNESGSRCFYDETDSAGHYSFVGVPAGAWEITVWPPSSSLFGGGATATVVAGQTKTSNIGLDAPVGLPGGFTVGGTTTTGSVPSVFFGDPVVMTNPGPQVSPAPTFAVRLTNGELVASGPLTWDPVSNKYVTKIGPFTGHGEAEVTVTGLGGSPVVFNLYIDPSGVVVDQYGVPIAGATATLMRSDVEAGPYGDVPDDDPLMSPSNRTNPMPTDSNGRFHWDVTEGWYKVTASAPGCTDGSTPALSVPPERTDLMIKLQCDGHTAPTAGAGPTITGTPAVGSTLSVIGATWPGAVSSSFTWVNGAGAVLGTGSTYLVKPGDAGGSIQVRDTGRRPTYTTEQGTGQAISFTEAGQLTSPAAGVSRMSSVASTRMSAARIRRTQRGIAIVTVRAAGVYPTGRVTALIDGGRYRAYGTLYASSRGTVRILLPRLRRGLHSVRAVYAGNAQVAGTTARNAYVRVR